MANLNTLWGGVAGFLLGGGDPAAVGLGSNIAISGLLNNRQLHRSEIEWIEDNAEDFRRYMCQTHNQCDLTLTQASALLRDEALSGVSDDYQGAGSQAARDFIKLSYQGPQFLDGQTMFGQLARTEEEFVNSVINIGYVNDYLDFYRGAWPTSGSSAGIGPAGTDDLTYEALLLAAAYDAPWDSGSDAISTEDWVDLYFGFTTKLGELRLLSQTDSEYAGYYGALANRFAMIGFNSRLTVDANLPDDVLGSGPINPLEAAAAA